jgi:cysteine desulfurase
MAQERHLTDNILSRFKADHHDSFSYASTHAEAVNQLFLSAYIDLFLESGRNHFLTTPIEEQSTLLSIRRLEKLGCFGKWLPLNSEGIVTPEVLEEAIRPRTALVSLSWANALTGVVQPIEELAKICRKKQVLFHVDAREVAGTRAISFQELGADFLSFEKGLLIKERIHLSPLILGGDEEQGEELSELDAALAVSASRFDHLCTETVRLRDQFERAILQRVPEAVVLFQECERLPTISAISFPGIHQEALLFALNRKGIVASIGGGSLLRLNHLLLSCGIESLIAHSAISFSFTYETTDADIERLVEVTCSAIQKLRQVSGALV